MNKKDKSDYMTVGELAEKAGVTVRTLQYYDQKGLLAPSVKGTRNQRLYTEKDLETLSRILTYKYMGSSLQEISDYLNEENSREHVAQTLHEKVMEAEQAIAAQIKRYLILKNMETLAENPPEEINWQDAVTIINYIDTKWNMIWQINQAVEGDTDPTRFPGFRLDEIGRYHKLIGETLQLMNEDVDPKDARVMSILEEYFKNAGEHAPIADWGEQQELIYNDIDNLHSEFDGATKLWTNINQYLETAVHHYFSK